ncbi:hypothetical protein BKP35_03760 [Anaerobacillus arseniciselenatis]|uniref:Core domain-containing protein n=1 Tax=Anaerobacillus arseniciselenatis TaxID=85682 RepID=A0A1S2LUB1_9BACI|nr:iron-sulfur cluster biosynthesis family protein [Anaerobacillus arseniciselenatis]OIJ16108.1 hypothetical protein BKP35_03760 [Anaerobacillus arseniciselenatis]
MEILFTEAAHNYINEYLKCEGALLLFYDTDGCGCAVNGVPVLFITSQKDVEMLEQIKTNGIPIYMYKKHTVFFDDQLNIDYVNGRLKLFSKNQVFVHKMAFKKLENHE